MAKPNAPASLSTCKLSSKVRLSIGDEQTDQAEISMSVQIGSTLDETRRYSTGMQFSILLPEGAVVADPAAAKVLARKEAASMLRKMAASIAKGG